MVEGLSTESLAQRVRTTGGSIQGDAAISTLKKLAPEMVKGKNLTSVQFNDKGEFTAHYKDANGKDATLSFSQSSPCLLYTSKRRSWRSWLNTLCM